MAYRGDRDISARDDRSGRKRFSPATARAASLGSGRSAEWADRSALNHPAGPPPAAPVARLGPEHSDASSLKDHLSDRTLEVWQPRTGRPLSPEEARLERPSARPLSTNTSPSQMASVRPGANVAELSGTSPSLWERRSGRRLSHEDDRQIRENLSGFFRVLAEWDRELRDDP